MGDSKKTIKGDGFLGNNKEVTKTQLLRWIEDYRWMVESIEESRQPADSDGGYIGAKTAMYGIEATMPKAAGMVSDPVFFEIQRRLQFGGMRVQQYERKVSEIQKRMPLVTGDRENEVLNRLLSGESMRAIGRHMHLSTTTISKLRETILKQMTAYK